MISARPLTSTPADQTLYVRRAVDERIDRALAEGVNVLLRVRRGAGATSMLFRLEGEHPDAVVVDASMAESSEQVLQALAARSGLPRRIMANLAEAWQRIDPLAPPTALRELRSALEEQKRHLLVCVDGPLDPSISHDLFGRHRDAVFSLPATWLVAAHDDRLGEYLTPPADVFFEHVDHIEDLDRERAQAILSRRGILDELTPRLAELVLDAHDGTPRNLLALARAQRMRDPATAEAAVRAYTRTTEHLPRSAAMLLAELQGRGAVSATDPELLSRLGVTDRQLRRNFALLEQQGLVNQVPAGRQGPGRPPAMYMLTDVGSAADISADRSPGATPS